MINYTYDLCEYAEIVRYYDTNVHELQIYIQYIGDFLRTDIISNGERTKVS